MHFYSTSWSAVSYVKYFFITRNVMHWGVEISKAWSLLDEKIPKVSRIVGIYFSIEIEELFEDFE